MISVCLATYNGEVYIKKQICSILEQLNIDDELIIVDDKSTDSTIKIINNFNDPRIRLFTNKFNVGHVQTFEKAISLTRGEFIFLSDQDDYWLNNRINICINHLKNSNSLLLISNMVETKTQGLNDSIRNFKMPKSNFFCNLFNLFFSKSLYFGSLMCFKKELKSYIIPFPNFVIAHDIYIAFISNSISTIIHLDKVLLLRTNTGVNLTYKKRKIFEKIKFKLYMFHCFFYSLKFKKF